MVAQVGSTVFVTDSTANISGVAVTVPGGALGMLIFWSFDSGTNGSVVAAVSCTGAGTFTISQNVPTVIGSFERCAGVAYADVTSTGAKTFAVSHTAALNQGAIYAIVFIDSAPIADSLVRGSGGDNTSASAALVVSANSTSASLVMAYEGKYNAVPTPPSGWTSIGSAGVYNSMGARISTADAPGASSTTFTAPAPDYSAAVVIALGVASSAPTITADQGSYTVSGQTASLFFNRLVIAEQGSYTLTGQDATLTHGTPGTYSITCDSGTYTIAGTDAYVDLSMNAEYGVYGVVGQDVTLTQSNVQSYSITAEQGTYSLSGQDVSFILTTPQAYTITADQGLYSLVGQSARLSWSNEVITTNGNYTIAMSMRIGI